MRPSLLLVLAVLGSPALAADPQPTYVARGAPTLGRPASGPVAALFVTQASLRSPQDVTRVADTAADMGVRVLFIQAVARGDATYDSRILPRVSGSTSAFDALGYVVPRARERGLEVHAWINTFLVWSSFERPPDSRHVVWTRPAWVAGPREMRVLRDWESGRQIELFQQGLFLTPIKREVRDYVVEIVREVALQYDVDGIYLDYLRYPSGGTVIDAETRTAFQRLYYVDPPIPARSLLPVRDQERLLWGTAFPDNDPGRGEFHQPAYEPPPDVIETPADILPSIREPELPPELAVGLDGYDRDRTEDLYRRWTSWKADRVTQTVRAVREELRRWRPDMDLSAAVIPDIAHARNDLGQDWTRWVKDGLVDFVVPQFYAVNTNLVRDQMRNVTAAVGTAPVLAGVATFNEGPEQAAEKIRAAREMGYSGVGAFSYESLRGRPDYWRTLSNRLGR